MADEQKANSPRSESDSLLVDGIPFPSYCKLEILRKLPDIPVFDDDVYVTGFPKSGAHWIMTIIEAIFRAGDLDDFVKNGPTFNKALMEFEEGYEAHLKGKQPRIIHTHVRPNMMPAETSQNKGKVIHIMRNPSDVAVSAYHFIQQLTILTYNAPWNDFFDAYINGNGLYGTWYDYLTDWLKYRDRKNMLFLKYEDFKQKPKEMIHKLALFFEKELQESTVERIAEIVEFRAMKNHSKLNAKQEIVKGDILRKGIVGDWVNLFTPEQDQKVQEMYQKFKAETGVEFQFK